MTSILKKSLTAFALLICVNMSWAAFPTAKEATAVTVNSANTTIAEKSQVVATASNESKNIAASERKSGGGGGKSKILAALLALFLGTLGIHSFYMKKTGKGFLQLGLTILGYVLLIAGAVSTVASLGTTATISGTAIAGLIIIYGVAIWALVDFVRILTGGLQPEEGFSD